MSIVEAFLVAMQPRDHRSAGRAVSVLCAVSIGVTVIFAPFQPSNADVSATSLAIAVATLLAVGLLSWSARFFDEASRVAWALCPLLTVGAIVDIDYLTADAS